MPPSYLLSPLSLSDGDDILQMLHEIGPGENGFGNRVWDMPASEFPAHLQSMLDMASGLNLAPHLVPQITYWLRRDGYPVAMSRLRTRLNEALLKVGGHIGYCVRPSERGKGLAVILLNLTLKEACGFGIQRALITCNADNTPSWRTIEHCGGILEKIENNERYYWVDTGSTEHRTEN
jgi:predicted acetyltransferase